METLTKNPSGWNKIGLSFLRNTVYKSVLRSMTLPFRFGNKSGSGYNFILSEYESKGIYASIIVTIKRRNPNTNDYDFFYSGKIDFKPPKFIIDRDVFIEASLLDNARLELLKSREETEFNLFNLVSPDGVTVTDFAAPRTITLPDIPIVLQADIHASAINYAQTVNQAVTASYAFLNGKVVNKNQIGDAITIDGSEIIYTNLHTEDINLLIYASGVYHYYGTIYNPTGTIKHTSITISVTLKTFDAGGGTPLDTITYVLETINQNDYTDKAFDISGTFPFHTTEVTLPVGGYCEYVSTVNFTTDSGSTHYAVVNHYNVLDSLYITENLIGIGSTATTGLFIHEVLSRLIQILTSESDTSKLFYSEILGNTNSEFETYLSDGEFSKDFLFSGKMCRNYPSQPINVSLKKIIQQLNCQYNIGFGYDSVNDRFYVDTIDKFYDATYQMFDLGEVSKFKRTPMSEAYFSQIKAGYDFDGEYEDYNGAFEFNLGKDYSTPTPVKEELDLVAPYRTDSVGIQLTRKKQYADFESIDTKGDDSIFLVRTDGTSPVMGSLPILPDGFFGIGNYYNTMLTPRQNMVRNGSIIIPTLYKNSNPVKYVKSTKECEMRIYSTPSVYVDENSDISQNELGTPLFIPEKFTFESHLTPAQIAILLTNPHGYILFTYNGIEYNGYIDKVELGDYNKKATFDLIAKEVVIDNNFTFEDGSLYEFEDGIQKEFE